MKQKSIALTYQMHNFSVFFKAADAILDDIIKAVICAMTQMPDLKNVVDSK